MGVCGGIQRSADRHTSVANDEAVREAAPMVVNPDRSGWVRAAGADDAEAVRAVWEAVAAEGEWIGTELPLRPDWVERFRNDLMDPEVAWFVAVEETVVGAIIVRNEGGRAHVGMAISDGFRGRGLGRLLLVRGLDWASDRGAHKAVLEVWPHNERARGLYTSAGFLEEGYLKRHYRRRSGALWDAVAMGLVLDSDSPGRP